MIQPWYICVAYFFAGAFLANSVPHFVSGMMGRKFHSPFAKPPGRGLSSPVVNTLWGLSNIIIGFVLLNAGSFQIGLTIDSFFVLAGVATLSLPLSSHFGKIVK